MTKVGARASVPSPGKARSGSIKTELGSRGEEILWYWRLARWGRRMVRLPQELEEKDREIERLRRRLVVGAAGGPAAGGIRPENVVWIFGSGRTGSTWLADMMGSLTGHAVWREPLVGALFGNLYYVRADHRRGEPDKHFILSGSYKDTWLGPMRAMVLGGAAARFPEVADGGYLVIKEPNGSTGAPLLAQGLPESRIVLLTRDPRDVVASSLDARKEGGWLYENRDRIKNKATNKPLDRLVRGRAEKYLRDMGNSKEAYDAHEGPKALVRYEDLRADALGTMRRLYAALGIPVGEEELGRAVEEHAWENIPEKEKGTGKFYRKATPNGWREDLTPEQARVVEEITAPLLGQFYEERAGDTPALDRDAEKGRVGGDPPNGPDHREDEDR